MTTHIAELIRDLYPKLPYAEAAKLAGEIDAKAAEFERTWFPLHEEFSHVKLVVMSLDKLNKIQTDALVGMFVYACKVAWHFIEDVADYEIFYNTFEDYVITELTFYCDGTKTFSDDPNYAETTKLFQEYLIHGTPAYKTDRKGKKGDRLIQPLTEHVDVLVLAK